MLEHIENGILDAEQFASFRKFFEGICSRDEFSHDRDISEVSDGFYPVMGLRRDGSEFLSVVHCPDETVLSVVRPALKDIGVLVGGDPDFPLSMDELRGIVREKVLSDHNLSFFANEWSYLRDLAGRIGEFVSQFGRDGRLEAPAGMRFLEEGNAKGHYSELWSKDGSTGFTVRLDDGEEKRYCIYGPGSEGTSLFGIGSFADDIFRLETFWTGEMKGRRESCLESLDKDIRRLVSNYGFRGSVDNLAYGHVAGSIVESYSVDGDRCSVSLENGERLALDRLFLRDLKMVAELVRDTADECQRRLICDRMNTAAGIYDVDLGKVSTEIRRELYGADGNADAVRRMPGAEFRYRPREGDVRPCMALLFKGQEVLRFEEVREHFWTLMHAPDGEAAAARAEELRAALGVDVCEMLKMEPYGTREEWQRRCNCGRQDLSQRSMVSFLRDVCLCAANVRMAGNLMKQMKRESLTERLLHPAASQKKDNGIKR